MRWDSENFHQKDEKLFFSENMIFGHFVKNNFFYFSDGNFQSHSARWDSENCHQKGENFQSPRFSKNFIKKRG